MHWNILFAQAPAAAPSAATPTATTTAAGTAATAGTQTAQTGSPFGLLFPMALFGIIIYFMMIRPQNQQRKKQAALIAALKAGDKVVTASGIHGVVVTVRDATVSIRSHDSKMEVAKSAIVQILDPGTATES
jgi:preprotein translocase subunit YajC